MKLDKKFIFFILLLALCTILGNLLFLFSIQQISPGIAQLTQRTEIIFVLYLSWFFLKEKVSFRVNLAVLVIFFGISILKWDSANISQFITGLLPIFFAILSGFFFACMQLVIQEAVKKFTPAFINIWRLGVTLWLLFVFLLIFLPNLQSVFNPNSSFLCSFKSESLIVLLLFRSLYGSLVLFLRLPNFACFQNCFAEPLACYFYKTFFFSGFWKAKFGKRKSKTSEP